MAGAEPGCMSRLCWMRANATLAVSLVGAVVALVFGATAGCASAPFFVLAAMLAAVAVLAWFQRGIERQISKFGRENRELRETRAGLDAGNEELRKTRAALESENRELREMRVAFGDENRELRETRAALDAENLELKGHVQNLQKLHNNSVNMIRQLAMYGDECKEFGQELRDISSDLQETDDSLGLTAAEIQKQVKALSAVVAATTRAAGKHPPLPAHP